MPCTFKNGQEVFDASGKTHIITGIRKDTHEVTAGWGPTTIEDTFVQVDGKSIWHGWGNFKAQEK